MLRFSKIAVALALALSLGAHWAVLQSAAWVSMLARYSQRDSFLVALSKTFDGKHPCSICLLVRAGKEAEKESEKQVIQIQKHDLFLPQSAFYLFAAPRFDTSESSDAPPPARSQPPPTPPPRAV